MRKLLPILAGFLVMGCSLPKTHDNNLAKKPKIPYVEEAPVQGPVSEGSLWQDRPVVGDLRAGRMNDLVTVKITESTSAISKADVTTKRDGSNSWAAPSLITRLSNWGITTDAKTSNANKYAGTGTTGRSATFTTTVTARVVKVLNNGNLIFEGFRDIQLNNENQRLYVAGMIDPLRLDNNNSIASGQVAELRVGYGGQGVVDETLKPGYISRLLNFIWPF
jgi:flagellar L-ring protein precursor FlgH